MDLFLHRQEYNFSSHQEIRMPREKFLDWAWVHGTVVVEGDYTCVRCNYCSQVLRGGGITSLKKHLARVQGFCPSVPKSVMIGCQENFEESGPDRILKLKSKQKKVPVCESHIENEIVEDPDRRKNGKALDSAWSHGTAVVEGNFRLVRCNYCLKVLNSGITGLKKHLARFDVGVKSCLSVPQVVSDGFRENFEESGPSKIPTLKRHQKKVPLSEGQSGDPTNVNVHGGTPEENGEHSANAGPTKSQSSPSNSGHTALMKGMSNSRAKTGKEIAERVTKRLEVNLTEGDCSQVRTRTHGAQLSSDFTPIINVEDSSSDDGTGPHTSQRDSQVRIRTHSAHISPDCIPIIDEEDSRRDDETGLHTSLTDTLSKRRRTDDAFGLRTDDAFGPPQRLHTSDTYP